MPIYLRHLEGRKKDLVDSFDKDRIRIGRQPDNDLRFDPQKDAAVSGYHAEIYQDGEAFFVKDLKSRNGTFLNGHRVDQPVALKEGDILEFSPRGPKVSFSSKDPLLATGTAVFEAEEISPGQAPKPEKKRSQWKTIGPIAGSAVALLLAFVGFGYFVDWSGWAMFMVGAGVLLLAGGGVVAWRWWKERRAVKAEQATAHRGREAGRGRGDNLQDLRQKWPNVLRILRGSNLQRQGEDPIYALPWFMVLGRTGSGKSALIKAGGPLSSVTSAQQNGSTRNCDWWFFDKVLLLDTSGRYAFQSGDGDGASEWRELLAILKSQRRREPVNGAVIAVAADSLASTPVEGLKEEAAQLRQRLDEMVQQLGIRFPVYLAVCKCDRVAGFREFFEHLPDSVKGQAMGCVNSDPARVGDASAFLDESMRIVTERAERLRLALFAEEEREEVMRPLFLFPTELKRLQIPLKAFVDVLFRASPYHEAPFFRGLLFSSARQDGGAAPRLSSGIPLSEARAGSGGTSGDFFLRDLFSVVLPNDRPLVRRTARWRERDQLAKAAGLIIAATASLAICGLFTLSFTANKRALSRLDLASCVPVAGTPAPRSIADAVVPLDGCRQTVETLYPRSIAKKISLNFGLRQTHRVGSALQERFLTAFRSTVLSPLESRIDQALADGSRNSLLIGAILQRIHVLTHCQGAGGCPDPEKWEGPNYRVMLTVEDPQLKDGDIAVDRLRRTHQSYLLWQSDPKLFREMQAKDLERIRRWLSSGGLREEAILESARAQFPAIRVADFWGVNASGQVDAAYTARAWLQGIRPLVAGLQELAVEGRDFSKDVKEFEESYRNEALRQWANLLVEFPKAEESARGRGTHRPLALTALGAESPYHRVIESVRENLSVILSDRWQAGDLPPWATTLRQYAVLRDPPAPEGQGKEAEASVYLTAYLDALAQLRGELSTTEKSFASAKRAFEEGEPTGKTAHPVLKAAWNFDMLKRTLGSLQEDDRAFWLLLRRPVDLAWTAILEEAGKYLAGQWESLYWEISSLPPEQKGAKVIAFVTGSANAFLVRDANRYAPRKLLNQNVPFTDAFIRYLARLRPDSLSAGSPQPPAAPDPPSRIVRIS